MRSIWVIVFIIFTLVILRLTVFSGNESSKGSRSSSTAVVPVTATIAKPQSLDKSLKATGSILAFEAVSLMPEAAGRITFMNIEEGKPVKKGQLLVKLNDQELAANLLKAEAMLKLQKSQLSRQEELVKIQGLSVEEKDKTQQAFDAAKAEVEYFKALINKTEIRAPFDGVLGFKQVSEGAFVNTSTIICDLYQINKLKLEFALPEKYQSQLSVPFEVSFSIQGNTKKHIAKVYAINPNVDSRTRALRLRAVFDNSDNSLIPGRFADVDVPISRENEVLMLPTQCIIPVLKGQKVWVAKNGIAKSKEVQIGYRTDKLIEILSGIEPGDTVLTSGIMSIRDGSAIRISQINNGRETP